MSIEQRVLRRYILAANIVFGLDIVEFDRELKQVERLRAKVTRLIRKFRDPETYEVSEAAVKPVEAVAKEMSNLLGKCYNALEEAVSKAEKESPNPRAMAYARKRFAETTRGLELWQELKDPEQFMETNHLYSNGPAFNYVQHVLDRSLGLRNDLRAVSTVLISANRAPTTY